MLRDVLALLLTEYAVSFCSYGLVKSYNMPCAVESASLEPKYGNKFVTGGEDMWVRVFDFFTGEELGELICFNRFRKFIELITPRALSEFFFFQRFLVLTT